MDAWCQRALCESKWWIISCIVSTMIGAAMAALADFITRLQ